MDPDGIIEEEANMDQRLLAQSANAKTVQANETTPLLNTTPETVPEWDNWRDFEGLPWYKQPSIYWIIPPYAIFALAYGGVVVPKLNLVKDLICRDYLAQQSHGFLVFDERDDVCRIPTVTGRASLFLMGDNILGGLLAAVASPYIGDLSDRHGRIPIIIFTLVGGVIKDVTSVLAAVYPKTFPVGWFYLGYVADGLCGSFIAGMSMVHCYVADCVPPDKRNVAFGLVHGMLFAGIGFGPLVASLVIKLTGSALSLFSFSLACHFLFVFCLVLVPESLSRRRQNEAREKHQLELLKQDPAERRLWARFSKFFTDFFIPLRILWPKDGTPRLRRNLVLLCAIDTVMFGVAMGALTVLILYTGQRFGWGNVEQSEFVSVVNISRVTSILVLLPIMTRLLRGPASSRPRLPTGADWADLFIIRIAVVADFLGCLGYTLSSTGTQFTVFGCIASIGGIGSPTLQSALTKHVPADKTGRLLGATAMLHALARVVSPLIFSIIFWKTVETYIQTVWLCLTVTFGLVAVLSWLLRSGVALQVPQSPVT